MPTPFVQRRIRHVTSIQVCNLTPFPLRDAFASAISKPTEPAQFATHGHLPDDLDATLSRKRGRRISTNSMTTLRSLHSDDGAGDASGYPEGRGRKRTISSTSSTRQAPTVRSQRVRTASISSTLNHSFTSTSSSDPHDVSIESTKALLINLPDHSQLGLEKVIKGRLVESFLSIRILSNTGDYESTESHHSRSASSSQPPSPLSHSQTPSTGKSAQRKGSSIRPDIKPSSPVPSESSASRRGSWAGSRTPTSPNSSRTHLKSSSSVSEATRQKPSPSFPTLIASRSDPGSSWVSESSIPDYLSAVHRPSTNPLFFVDPQSEFAPDSDTSGDKFRVGVWAKIGEERRKAATVNGKGKAREEPHSDDQYWQILEQWDVDLGEAVPLADDPNATLRLPSNTLVLTLSSPGQRYYVSTPRVSRTRSPSPSGYASDPETKVHKARIGEAAEPLVLPSRRHRRGARAESPGNTVKTAGWQDLFKLVSLQTCIVDTEASLRGIIDSINSSISESAVPILKREISERQCRVAELRSHCNIVTNRSQKLREDMRARREQLRHRQDMLVLARAQQDDDIQQREETEEEVIDEREHYDSLLSLFRPTRVTLISTLASIFPIELDSPPDLLYTILDVPLPIPLSSTDPAPPLSLPNHKDINEETVAAALGYAALLVQLLAAYLGKGLVYPVTYIGSRSLIRDGISAMVGPRMFPLFSKGVDTYRFEYGVFLLNKDIELLMVEYDLRAMDIRHTLPNLKNLLLTLTDGESIPAAPGRPHLSPITSLSELESPSDAPASPKDDSTTPKANDNLELPPAETTPPASGSTTPTAGSEAADTAKRSRFLGLSPLAGFLRVRYPSSLLAKGSEGTPPGGDGIESNTTMNGEVQPTSTSGNDLLDCEEDSRTIPTSENDPRSDVDELRRQEGAVAQENKSTTGNGHLVINSESNPSSPAEKHYSDRVSTLSTPSLPNVAD
ncbi:uv radiation resistance-associated protein [Moniliophthora roreri MCA 2997]|uniref:Autophagy-related protein 14 n=1 Tax=Moniliophthora roreri (strain MCA 2997) TaxID=1381753 RepID=V2Y093_MONRO|nr:uv radiation resistance-associated protein [Moniliophthora roreri MCA 2997]